ncbi:S-formylglutathione hydrolase [Sphingomonas kaistensis]|uniref:S-formylglutathione hydrolase n=1 Tax=Sphingomonas kaistensis TaxID=298708 RepID=A0ABZ2FZK4_9SPHN
MALKVVSEALSHGGRQLVLSHDSAATATPMTFSLFLPPQAEQGRVPLVTYLSGLTCTHANVTDKGEYRRSCAELGLAFLAPDTSPRGEGVADADGWDIGLGAGFYVDATETPWSANYRMWSYVTDELPTLVEAEFPMLDMGAQAITGHSMGGHGALTVALRHPDRFRSVSAFAPIVAPSQVPWGEKAFTAYLGADRDAWRAHDAVALIESGARLPALKVDVGGADSFLERELKPELLEQACIAAGQPLELAIRPGYDHSYHFVSTFLPDHLAWHAERLR